MRAPIREPGSTGGVCLAHSRQVWGVALIRDRGKAIRRRAISHDITRLPSVFGDEGTPRKDVSATWTTPGVWLREASSARSSMEGRSWRLGPSRQNLGSALSTFCIEKRPDARPRASRAERPASLRAAVFWSW